MTQPPDNNAHWVEGDFEAGADPVESTGSADEGATAARPTDTGRGEQPDLQPAEGTITEE